MNTENQTEPTAIELAEAKAKQLSEKYSVKVHALMVYDKEGKPVIGFLKEPNRPTKMMALDKTLTSPSSAGSTLLEACLIKEESDPRIDKEDFLFLGIALKALGMVEIATDVKKN